MGKRREVEGSAIATMASPTTTAVTSIALNPRNPRNDYDDIDELHASITEVGVLQPLGVVRYETYLTHYPEDEHEIGVCDWVVLHGNRRLVAARKAGLTEVPVHVVDRLGRESQLDESVLVENIHREALPPLREAEALRLLTERHGSQRKVAQRIGKTAAFVSQRLSLLKLEPQFRDELANGTLGIREALTVAARPAAEQEVARQELRSRSAGEHESPLTTDPKQEDDPESIAEAKPAARSSAKRQEPTRTIRVRTTSPAVCAEDLRKHLDADELAQLAELLTQPS